MSDRADQFGARISILDPVFKPRVAVFFAALVSVLALFAFLAAGARRLEFGALALACAGAGGTRLWREHVLVHHSLTVVGIVARTHVLFAGAPRWLPFLLHLFPTDLAWIDYSFVTREGRACLGHAHWNGPPKHKGASIPVVYRPDRPASNLPVACFVFYRFLGRAGHGHRPPDARNCAGRRR